MTRPRPRNPVTTGIAHGCPGGRASAARTAGSAASYATSAAPKSSEVARLNAGANVSCWRAGTPHARRCAANSRVDSRSPKDTRLSRARGVSSCALRAPGQLA